MTAETRAALNAMGAGMRLRIPHNGGPAEVVEGTPRLKRPTFAVSPKIVADLIAGFHIAKLPEHRTNGKLGWREMGYDGNVADWYACIQ